MQVLGADAWTREDAAHALEALFQGELAASAVPLAGPLLTDPSLGDASPPAATPPHHTQHPFPLPLDQLYAGAGVGHRAHQQQQQHQPQQHPAGHGFGVPLPSPPGLSQQQHARSPLPAAARPTRAASPARQLCPAEEGAIARILDACDLAGVPYDEMQHRIRARAAATTATPSPSPRRRRADGATPPPPPQHASNYTRLDPSWEGRAENLAQRYGVSTEVALELLCVTGGHAGKASRLIAAGHRGGTAAAAAASGAPPPASPAGLRNGGMGNAVPLLDLEERGLGEDEEERGGPRSGSTAGASCSPSPRHGIGGRHAAGVAGRSASIIAPSLVTPRPVSACRSHSGGLSPRISRQDTMNLADPAMRCGGGGGDSQHPSAGAQPVSGGGGSAAGWRAVGLAPSVSLMTVDTISLVSETPASPAELLPHLEQCHIDLAPNPHIPGPDTPPPVDPEFDFVADCELLTPIATTDTPAGKYVVAARKEWKCIAFFKPRPAVQRGGGGGSSPGDRSADAPSFGDVSSDGRDRSGVYQPPEGVLLFADITEVVGVDLDPTTREQRGGRTRSSKSGSNLGLIRLINGQGLHIRINIPPLQYSGALACLRQNVGVTCEVPFPVTTGYNLEFYRDGVQYYPRLAEALLRATESIFIAGWYLTPHVFLERKDPIDHNQRLDNLLQKKAFEGVQIRVLLYAEVEAAIPLASSNAALWLEGLHPTGIQVIRHRGPLAFTHHQKFVVVDQSIAFCGGLDLTWGRYDSHAHPLFDNAGRTWVGVDYRNPLLRGDDLQSQVKAPFADVLRRQEQHRMPWHDVHMRVCGSGAYHVALNFIQRWNHHLCAASSNRKRKCTRLLPDLSKADMVPAVLRGAWAARGMSCFNASVSMRSAARCGSVVAGGLRGPGTPLQGHGAGGADPSVQRNAMSVQLVRSICEWSGAAKAERSIQESLVNLIRGAQHSIYIENQFFVSSLYGPPVLNAVGSVLADRINQAARAKSVFRVLLLIQPHGEGNPATDPFVQRVIHFQAASLRKLVKRVKAVCHDRLSQYLRIGCLRNYGIKQETGVPVSSTVYIHSKLAIVDDQQMLIGSANINDRSLLGERDSELAFVIDDSLHRTGKVQMFRHRLLEEHMGEEGTGVLADTMLDQPTWDMVVSRMDANQRAFEAVMPECPSDRVATAEQAKQRQTMRPSPQAPQVLATVKGHICTYPLEWLIEAGQEKSMAERAAGTDFFV